MRKNIFFLLFQAFTDGRTNKLVGVWCSGHYTDMVLIRVYGNNSDLLIDRESEIKNIRVKILSVYIAILFTFQSIIDPAVVIYMHLFD